MDRSEIKRLFRDIAKQRGLQCSGSKMWRKIGDMRVECHLDNCRWDNGLYVNINVRHEALRAAAIPDSPVYVIQYRARDYECPHHELFSHMEVDADRISVIEIEMIADWTFKHVDQEWPSLEVIARKALDPELHRRYHLLVSGGMAEWARSYLADLK